MIIPLCLISRLHLWQVLNVPVRMTIFDWILVILPISRSHSFVTIAFRIKGLISSSCHFIWWKKINFQITLTCLLSWSPARRRTSRCWSTRCPRRNRRPSFRAPASSNSRTKTERPRRGWRTSCSRWFSSFLKRYRNNIL